MDYKRKIDFSIKLLRSIPKDVPFELYIFSSVPTEDYKMEHPRARTSVRCSLNGEVMTRKKLIEKLKEIEV